jgi:hypothetical protein
MVQKFCSFWTVHLVHWISSCHRQSLTTSLSESS